MRIRLQLSLWVPICILLLKDGDSNKFIWDQAVPYLDELCQVEGECNETLREKESLNIRQAENPCCKGCFCDGACPIHPITKYAGLTECFNTIDDERITKMYHVVAKAPSNGCVNNRPSSSGQKPSCGPDVVAAPWGNYYPVYSFDKKVNFKNIPCALCHGATDIIRWNVYPFFWGKNTQLLHAMRTYYNDFISEDVLLEFYPPTRESWQYEQICFSVKDSCRYEKRDMFRIPSHINLTREEVIQACEQGKVSPYRYSDDDVFRNVFCAICNSRASSIDGSVTCGVQKDPEEAIKGARGSFASLIDHKYIDSKLKRKKRNKNVKLACFPTNANSTSETRLCREVLCPALQIRSDDGACFYPMDKFFATKLEISLNLKTAERIDTSKLQNMSKAEISEVFKRTMPWPKSWEIVLVMLRVDTNSSEFVIVIGYRNFAFLNMRKFRRLLEVTLSRPWPVDIGQTYAFNQSFDVHGIPRKVEGPRKDAAYGKPKWTRLADTNEMIANLSSPTWQVLLWNSNVFYYDPPGEPLEITNLFLCDQIELYEDEFIGIINAYPALIKHNQKFVYPRQYYMYNGENGSQIINVCLEDSDYGLMPDNNAAPRLTIMLTSLLLLMLRYVMIFMMHYLY